jgi:tRNA pseudouridine55 synthase
VAAGTYLRSVAHDMGQHIGYGAHLVSLRRTVLGEFSLQQAHTLDELLSAALGNHQNPDLAAMFIHPRELLPQFPCVTAGEEIVAQIRSGRTVNLPDLSRARQVKVFAGQRELIAIATRIAGTLFHPRIVLAAASTKASPVQGARAIRE